MSNNPVAADPQWQQALALADASDRAEALDQPSHNGAVADEGTPAGASDHHSSRKTFRR